MLFHIVDSRVEDKGFEEIVKAIKYAYWPEERYKDPDIVKMLPEWDEPPSEYEMIQGIASSLNEMVECISKDLLYTQFSIDTSIELKRCTFPFIDCFHTLFLKRQYDCPYRDPKTKRNDILSLNPDQTQDPEKRQYENYSKNYGNYNHFVNVVMATARIIRYFQDPNKSTELLTTANLFSTELCKVLLYPDTKISNTLPGIREFKLMLAAFYHDIGKTVVDHRHGMEGAFILADHTTRSLSQLNSIASQYNNEYSLEREDLLEISIMLYYHDSFGTFGTGESSYMLLAEIIDRVKRGSLKYLGDPDPEVQKKHCNRMLFDLWVLNIADICVSQENKFELQEEPWLNKDDKDKYDKDKSNKAIKRFFESEGGKSRIHDLQVAMKLLKQHNTGTHQDDTIELEKMAQQEATSHCVERIKRLVCSSLEAAIAQFVKEEKADATAKQKEAEKQKEATKNYIDEFNSNLADFREKLLNCIETMLSTTSKTPPDFSSGAVHNIIFRSIESSNDSREFYKRFAWIVLNGLRPWLFHEDRPKSYQSCV